MTKYVFFIFFIFYFNEVVKTQSPPCYFIGENEFSSSDVYSMCFQNSTNTLFASTNRGVFRYRQNKFHIIRSSPKQIGDSFFSLIEDVNGKILCCNLSGQVFEIKDDFLELYYQIPKTESTSYCKIFFDNNNDLIVCTDLYIRRVSKNKDSTILFKNKRINTGIMNKTIQLVDGKIIIPTKGSKEYLVYDQKVKSLISFDDNLQFPIFFKLKEEVYYGAEKLRKISDSNFSEKHYFSSKTIFYQKNANEAIFSNPIDGVYILSLSRNKIQKKLLGFNNHFISCITQNDEGTLFLGTFNDGVIVIPNRYAHKHITSSYFNGFVANPKTNVVYLSDRKGQVYIHKDSLSYLNEYNYSLDRLFFLKGNYNIGDYNLNSFLYQKSEKSYFEDNACNIKDLSEYKKEFFCFISAESVHIVLSDSLKLDNPNFSKLEDSNLYYFKIDSRGKAICYNNNDNSLYYSTNKGLFVKEWNTANKRKILFNDKNILANDLVVYNEKLIIGTQKNGVLFYKNNKIESLVTLNRGLKSKNIRKIAIQEGVLFVQTALGFQMYDLILNKYIGLGDKEGVSSNNVYNFSITKDKVWLLEKSGYSSIELKNIISEKQIELPQLYLDSVIVNGRISQFKSNHFSYNENKFQFYFDFRSFETQRDAKFYYKLVGVSNEWKSMKTSSNLVEYLSLSPGSFEFQLKAVYRGVETNTIKYKFIISQPFWFQIWFFVLCIIFIILFVSIFFYFKIRRNAKKRKLEMEKQKMQSDIFESKLEAIRSQMNPHFIFNSLNSIQSLVLKEDKEKSYDTIEQFSDLVRKTLSFSEQGFVSIKEEIAFLQTYLSLESLRMKDEFTYTLENNYKRNIKIPSLLIQPFIENAIHHGLLHKTGEKHLKIDFYMENKNSYCSVTDNGIGRDEAILINKRQNNTHQSFSLKAMKDRLKILSDQHSLEYSYRIIDLYNESKEPIGTKVIIHFPFQDEY